MKNIKLITKQPFSWLVSELERERLEWIFHSTFAKKHQFHYLWIILSWFDLFPPPSQPAKKEREITLTTQRAPIDNSSSWIDNSGDPIVIIPLFETWLWFSREEKSQICLIVFVHAKIFSYTIHPIPLHLTSPE